jgi:DNA-binding transcriptional MerR regulator
MESTADLSIGRLARALGISTATINFYVSEGILPPPRKLNRTRAAYSERHLRLLRVIRRMQANGYSLALIKGTLTTYGTDEAGLAKLEGIGHFQPTPPVPGSPSGGPIEPFDPISEEDFLARSKCPPELVAQLRGLGLLRPRGGRFDARDLWLLKTVTSLLDDGVDPSHVAELGALVAIAERAVTPVLTRAHRHGDALRRRDMRFSSLLEPYGMMFGYLVDRLATERDPEWRTGLFHLPPSPASRDEAGRADAAEARPDEKPTPTRKPSGRGRPRRAVG